MKTTGGKGLHIVVPFLRGPSWDEAFEFSKSIAERMAEDDPERYTVDFDREKRIGRILIDYKRNYRTSIAVAGYSTRARPEATLSVPVRWEELSALKPETLTLAMVRRRLELRTGDPWRGYGDARQRLPPIE